MNPKKLIGLIGLICLLAIPVVSYRYMNEARVKKRAEEYAEMINYHYDEPEKIYAFLCKDYKAKISEERFVAAFEKERTYPYITPLHLMEDPEVRLIGYGNTAEVTFQQAARIEGMTYPITLVWEDGNYYVKDWEEFLDGSYLEKFEDIPYSLDWYYNNADSQ